MYTAQANNGSFKIIKSLRIIDPQECSHGIKQAEWLLQSCLANVFGAPWR